MTFGIHNGARCSTNLIQKRDKATQITTLMNSLSNQFVTIGKKPGF